MKRILTKINATIVIMLIILNSIAITKVKAIEPSSSDIYNGIDVSNYQGNIDYARVRSAGIEVVYIKATEGQTITDAYLRQNYENARANGLKIGFYHFVRARNNAQAVAEAEYFANAISGMAADCRLAMDFEVFGSLTNEEVNEISFTFLRRVEEITGKEMVVYSNTYSARTVFSQELANQYPLWVAEYGVNEPQDNGKWNIWIGFQYTDRGVVDGINGYVDRDRFTEQIFLSNTDPINPGNNGNGNSGNEGNGNNGSDDGNGENSENNNYITYTVRRGDTLSELALRYGTTVNEIAGINGIVNPNLIYTGEQLLIPTKNNTSNSGNNNNNDENYVVRRGDTLSKIALKYGTTVNAIARLNGIRNPNLIYVGQILQIPNTSNNAVTSAIDYTIQRGDTLSEIASRYGTTVNVLANLNGIRNPNRIYAGNIIKVPITTRVISNTNVEHDCGHCIYTVQRGDTLSEIAEMHETTVNEIVELNQIENPNMIYVGQKLRI